MGARFLLAPQGIGTLEMSAGISERPELEHFMQRCGELKPSRLIDIGANIGMYSCILLKSGCVPNASLFEPDRKNRAQLDANLLLNRLLCRTEVYPIALGESHRTFRLLPGKEDGGFSRIVENPEEGSYEVQVAPLDEILPLASQTLAIKIDVEGFEARVLAGMQRLLRHNRCLVQIEAFDPAPILGTMKSAGYRLTRDFLPNYVFEN